MEFNFVTTALVFNAISWGSFSFVSKSSFDPQIPREPVNGRYACAHNPLQPWKDDMDCKFTQSQLGSRTKTNRNSMKPGRMKPQNSQQWDLPYELSSTEFPLGSTSDSKENSFNQFLPFNDNHPDHKSWEEIERLGPNLTQPQNKINITAIIEGTGQYLCGLRGSSEFNSLILSVFVRELGFYRCYFHGGTFRMKSAVFGNGFYQCFLQKPGFKMVVRQGTGQFFAFFHGVRHAIGFLTPPPRKGPAEKKNFFYVFGSINYALKTPAGSPLGMAQLLGIYNYGPEGKSRNYGFLQVIESYNLNLQSIMGKGKEETKSESHVILPLKYGGDADLSVNQVGQFQYHFHGADIDEGRGDQFKTFTYNFIHTVAPHIFTLQFILYEMRGQGRGPLDDRQFFQAWAFYRYNFENTLPIILSSYLQAFFICQFNFENPELGIETAQFPLHGQEFIQFVLQFSKSFVGFRLGDVVTVTWTGTFQSNIDTSVPDYLVIEEEDALSELVIVDDLVITALQLAYNFVRRDGAIVGVAQVYGIYQYYLNEVSVEHSGYIQLLFAYTSTHKPFEDKDHSIAWTAGALADFVIGEPDISYGSYRVQVNLVLDTTGWFEVDLENGVPPKPSSITLVAIYVCLWFGIRSFRPVCYIQAYLYFIGTIGGGSNPEGVGQTVLLCQYYQETRV